jgi:predicted RNase H-like HicB family nuclease
MEQFLLFIRRPDNDHARLLSHLRTRQRRWLGRLRPDLPGLGVAAETREEVAVLIREGIALHIAGLREDGLPIPEPITTAERIAVAA